ncbi:MAG: hypothetical protein FJY98_00275 [Candidatus Liptonbacteria bacterium]|nr:hypothetical protein [Candidatus Liptonbacteria bacterium]
MKKQEALSIIFAFVILGAGSILYLSGQPSIPAEEVARGGWNVYKNTQFGFEFRYPSNYRLNTNVEKEFFYNYELTKIAELSAEETYLDAATFSVSIDNAPSGSGACLKKEYGERLLPKDLNGATWYGAKQGDAAMGGARGEIGEYRTVHADSCFVIRSELYWHLVGYGGYIQNGKNDATPEEVAGQRNAIEKHSAALEGILSSFRFTE